MIMIMIQRDLSFKDYNNENKILKVVIVLLICSIFSLLLALFVFNKSQYNILVDFGDDSTYSDYVVEKGDKVSNINIPQKNGYKFLYWEMDGKKVDGDSKITKDLKLVAMWAKIYSVTFETDGGSDVASQKVIENEKVIEPDLPVKDGYVFSGWTLNGSNYDFNSAVTSDIVLKATWTEFVKNSFVVTFDSVGGSKVDSQIIEVGDKAKIPNNPTKNGYTFVAWLLNGQSFNFDSIITSNITLIASWKKVGEQSQNPQPVPEKKKYTVTFDSAGGSNVSSQIIVERGKVSEPKAPSKNDYVFNGWYLNGVKYDFNKTITGDIVLTAKWSQVVKNYTITATPVDAYSPDRVLKVYENGNLINFSQIQYEDGTIICDGSNPTVAAIDIEGESNFIVVLTNGVKVNAKKV